MAFKAYWTEEDINAFQAVVFGSAEPYDLFMKDILRSDGMARQVFGESIRSGGFKDEMEVISKLKVPIAIMLGERDGYLNKSYLEGLNIPTLWRGEVQIIPNAGHTPQWEQPERFNQILEEFIESL